MNVQATFPNLRAEWVQVPTSILCVDDSEEILEICRTMLEASGYQVFTATCGTEALEILQKRLVQAAVLDNLMPGMSGVELAREIKRSGAEVRVIMFSSSEPADDCLPFIDSYLSKGEGPLALRKLIATLLKK